MRAVGLALALLLVAGCRNGVELAFDVPEGGRTASVVVSAGGGRGGTPWRRMVTLRASGRYAILLPEPGQEGMPELPWALALTVDRLGYHERCVETADALRVELFRTPYDADGDGYRGRAREGCPPEPMDCHDGRSDVHPGAALAYAECERLDANCDGVLDPCADRDGDGWPICAMGEREGCDCDDARRDVAPGRPDPCEDGADSDCDGIDPRCDRDGDGVPPPADCDDADRAVFPGAAERCNGVDDTCDGVIDEDAPCRTVDLDGDGLEACAPGDTDCDPNDCDVAIHPGARDACGDGVDADGDGDDACPARDGDGDGYAPVALGGSDCDDADPLVYPLAPDRCGDGIAGDCRADRPCSMDVDGDGWIEPGPCEDGLRTPGAPERCNGRDDDCDDRIDEMLSPPSADRPDGEVGCTADPRPITYASDVDHCGACGAACDRARADGCRAGACVCGTRSACSVGEACRGGACGVEGP